MANEDTPESIRCVFFPFIRNHFVQDDYRQCDRFVGRTCSLINHNAKKHLQSTLLADSSPWMSTDLVRVTCNKIVT